MRTVNILGHRPILVFYDLNTGTDTVVLEDGTRLINVHRPTACAGRACVIHNPSRHHMSSWPMLWRNDRQIFERICPCGVGHPDPDQHDYLQQTGDGGVHGCCGCCLDNGGGR